MTDTQKNALKIATVLWVIWGLVHAFAGVVVLSSDASSGFAAIADAVDPAALAAEYHPAAGGILNQHGWNLLWFGVATIIGGVLIWRGNMTAIWVTGMVGGLADLEGGSIRLRGEILRTDGTEVFADDMTGAVEDGAEMGRAMAAKLLAQAGPDFF